MTSSVAPRRTRDQIGRSQEVSPGKGDQGELYRQSQITSRALRLASDASWAEGAGVGAEFLECASECLDVGVGEVAGEVLFDRVSVVAARLLHRGMAFVGEDDGRSTAPHLRLKCDECNTPSSRAAVSTR